MFKETKKIFTLSSERYFSILWSFLPFTSKSQSNRNSLVSVCCDKRINFIFLHVYIQLMKHHLMKAHHLPSALLCHFCDKLCIHRHTHTHTHTHVLYIYKFICSWALCSFAWSFRLKLSGEFVISSLLSCCNKNLKRQTDHCNSRQTNQCYSPV